MTDDTLRNEHGNRLSNEELEYIFHNEIEALWFTGLYESEIIYPHKVVFTGGQPGSGKSAINREIQMRFDSIDVNTTILINGDEYRPYIPGYQDLIDEDDITAATKIGEETGQLTERVIDASISKRLNAVIEGTFRNPQTVLKTAAKYKEAGYETETVLLLVHPLHSRLGIIERYIGQKEHGDTARFTESDAHNSAFSGIPTTIEAILDSDVIDALYFIFGRDSHPEMVADITSGKFDKAEIVDKMQEFYNSELPQNETISMLKRLNSLESRMQLIDISSSKTHDKITGDIQRLRNDLLIY
jgi:hypothetical protein